jgi:predicted ribosomally synthesized peptide with SipW-like signal peptide
MSRTNLKRYLMLLAVIGLVAIASGGGSGTFASFNAEVANTGNTFQTGTLFLHDNGTCTSETAGNNRNIAGTGCNSLFTIIPSTFISSGHTYSANLTLTNAGSLDAAPISFDLNGNGCTDSKPQIATLGAGISGGSVTTLTLANLSETLVAGTKIELHENTDTETFTVQGGPYTAPNSSVLVNVADQTGTLTFTPAATVSLDAFGAGLCSQLKLSIQEETSSGFGAPVTGCAFPSSASVCGATGTLLNDSILGGLQPLTLDNTGLNNNLGTQLTAKQSRYFKINIQVPDVANTAQNDQVSFDLRWHIDQA